MIHNHQIFFMTSTVIYEMSLPMICFCCTVMCIPGQKAVNCFSNLKLGTNYHIMAYTFWMRNAHMTSSNPLFSVQRHIS